MAARLPRIALAASKLSLSLLLLASGVGAHAQFQGDSPSSQPFPAGSATRLPSRAAPSSPGAPPVPERVSIDLGEEQWPSEPPQTINILAPLPESPAASAAELKLCEDERDAGVVAGEIVVCRQLPADTSQLYSGTREAWEKDYAQRTMNAGTLPPPDVAGAGIFRGAPTVSGLCLIPPCPDEAPLIIDVEAIETPPEGSDAARVAQGLAPLDDDAAPLSDEARRRVEAELGLPATPGS